MQSAELNAKDWKGFDAVLMLPVSESLVAFGQSFFEITFAQMDLLPRGPEVIVKSKVVMSPLTAKMFLRGLQRTVEQYESVYGPIILKLGKTGQVE